jgi:transposase
MRSLAVVLKKQGGDVNDAYLGIDVSKNTLDTDCGGRRRQSRSFGNGPEGWRQLLAWLKAMGIEQAHVCLEATGRYSLGVALALHEAGHIVSVVNPAQIHHFAALPYGSRAPSSAATRPTRSMPR